MARLYVLLEGEVNQERSEEAVRQHMAPHKVTFKETEWFSTYSGIYRLLSRLPTNLLQYKKQWRKHSSPRHMVVCFLQVMLLMFVDAVNGGQGLNTGVANAFALSWRLNMAIKGAAPQFCKHAIKNEQLPGELLMLQDD